MRLGMRLRGRGLGGGDDSEDWGAIEKGMASRVIPIVSLVSYKPSALFFLISLR